jgi:hypothetical protein
MNHRVCLVGHGQGRDFDIVDEGLAYEGRHELCICLGRLREAVLNVSLGLSEKAQSHHDLV